MKTTEELITPDMAKELIARNRNNRPISEKHVTFLADQMRRGQWMMTHQGIALSKFNDILDGQHRLLAVIKSNCSINTLLSVGSDPATFPTMDTGKTRSAGDTFYIQGVKSYAKMASGIGSYLRSKGSNNLRARGSSREYKVSNTDILNEYKGNEEFWQDHLAWNQKYYAKLKIMTITNLFTMTAMLIKERRHPEETVKDFLDKLYTLKPSDNVTIDKLRDILLKNTYTNKPLKPKFRTALIIKAWNFYISGREVKVLKLIEDEVFPVLI